MNKRDSKTTRSGRPRVDGGERRSWQRTSRRSYTAKAQGSNAIAIAAAKRNGTYGQTPESRMAANLRMKRADPPADPTCQHCGSDDVMIPEEQLRYGRVPQKYSLLCGQCQSSVVDSLKTALIRSRNWVAAKEALEAAAAAAADEIEAD